jgi:RNA polymerase sigma-70 factor (ECF subfamily)
MSELQPDGTPARAPLRGDVLVDEVYDALRAIARRALARLPGRLDPTDLVHQAWMDVSGSRQGLPRAEFYALCATVMRRIAVDEARRLGARRDAPERITFSGVACEDTPVHAVDLLDLDEALDQLRTVDERWARIVELRYFGGLTGDEVASVLGLSRKTVVRDWALARAWLKNALGSRDTL